MSYAILAMIMTTKPSSQDFSLKKTDDSFGIVMACPIRSDGPDSQQEPERPGASLTWRLMASSSEDLYEWLDKAGELFPDRSPASLPFLLTDGPTFSQAFVRWALAPETAPFSLFLVALTPSDGPDPVEFFKAAKIPLRQIALFEPDENLGISGRGAPSVPESIIALADAAMLSSEIPRSPAKSSRHGI